MVFPEASLPEWNSYGHLPAILVDPTSPQGSPYVVSIPNFVERFGSSVERCRLLLGLLEFRAQLRLAGIVRGFQWIDGSFVEYIEQIQDRAPNDLDIVTFFHIPEGQTQESLVRGHPAIFDSAEVNQNYAIDAYFVPLGETSVEDIITSSIYWYRLWSQTREQKWKGYVSGGSGQSG